MPLKPRPLLLLKVASRSLARSPGRTPRIIALRLRAQKVPLNPRQRLLLKVASRVRASTAPVRSPRRPPRRIAPGVRPSHPRRLRTSTALVWSLQHPLRRAVLRLRASRILLSPPQCPPQRLVSKVRALKALLSHYQRLAWRALA